MGIVSPIAGFGGIMQAITVVNIILGCKNKIFRELIIFDGFTRDMKKIRIEKNVKCKICKC
jgi:molybdopterin/thiamine biosynthesis adenylyltransferase